MHGDIDFALEHRRVDFLREQTLSARFRKRAILNHVSAGADDDDLETPDFAVMGDGQQATRFMRLS
jgi:hypothetical protein